MIDQAAQTLQAHPIGYIRTDMRVKFDAPHQPSNAENGYHVIELIPGRNFELALRDLQGFERIWLLWWFHKNSTWRPLVLPPRGPARRRGVFATRSPHRPNALGLSTVPLLAIKGRRLIIGASDLIDQTPILDIKPYIPEVDAFPSSNCGWLGELDGELRSRPSYTVSLEQPAAEQIAWLKQNWNVKFIDRAKQILERDPSPHRTRRISKAKGGGLRMGCGAWRLYYRVQGTEVLITCVTPGYPSRLLADDSLSEVPDREAQIAFGARWPK